MVEGSNPLAPISKNKGLGNIPEPFFVANPGIGDTIGNRAPEETIIVCRTTPVSPAGLTTPPRATSRTHLGLSMAVVTVISEPSWAGFCEWKNLIVPTVHRFGLGVCYARTQLCFGLSDEGAEYPL